LWATLLYPAAFLPFVTYSTFFFTFAVVKQLFSILLLAIFAFNIFGYKIYFAIAENNSDISIENKIEKQEYNSTDLVTYKISAKQLPYYTNSKSFEIAKGEVEVNGIIMTYVKKRIFKDTMEYVCLPNQTKTNLRTAKDDFFKMVNDFQQASTSKHPVKTPAKNIKPFTFDAIAFESNVVDLSATFLKVNSYAIRKIDNLPNPYLSGFTPPPNFIAC
jgi:hypothetical protein